MADSPATLLYAVRTTGVVCRVGCASRPPRPENVVWVRDLTDALTQGFRPCRRCRPDATHPQVDFRRRTVEAALGMIRLGRTVEEAAAALHVSDRHLRRLVRQETGKSPREAA
jgi:AraC family transcriptional regulator of adaptative response/methylated-DNA-[protein]-cysteine methyltransferase